MIGDDLQPHRQPLRSLPGRHAHARDSRQIAGHCVDIGKIHRRRIVDFLAQLERRERRHRAHDRVHLFECLGVILRHQSPHFLRFQIVRVVVTRAQHVGSQHDAALALRAEALFPSNAVHICQSASGLGTARIAHAVITRQVRAGLRRTDDVVASHRISGVRQRDLADLASQLLERGDRCLDHVARVAREAVEELLRYTDLHSADVPVECRHVIRNRSERRGGIHLVASRHYLKQPRGIAHRPRKRPDMVERAGERRQSVARDAAICRRYAGYSAERRRLANRPAGIRSQR